MTGEDGKYLGTTTHEIHSRKIERESFTLPRSAVCKARRRCSASAKAIFTAPASPTRWRQHRFQGDCYYVSIGGAKTTTSLRATRYRRKRYWKRLRWHTTSGTHRLATAAKLHSIICCAITAALRGTDKR